MISGPKLVFEVSWTAIYLIERYLMNRTMPGIAIALVTLSASCAKEDDDDAASYTACILEKTDETTDLEICTAEFVNRDVADNASCQYETCKVPDDGDCPTFHVKGKVSSAPTQDYCSYSRPTEL